MDHMCILTPFLNQFRQFILIPLKYKKFISYFFSLISPKAKNSLIIKNPFKKTFSSIITSRTAKAKSAARINFSWNELVARTEYNNTKLYFVVDVDEKYIKKYIVRSDALVFPFHLGVLSFWKFLKNVPIFGCPNSFLTVAKFYCKTCAPGFIACSWLVAKKMQSFDRYNLCTCPVRHALCVCEFMYVSMCGTRIYVQRT